MCNVVIASGSESKRKAISTMLSHHNDVIVTGNVADGETAFVLAQLLHPDAMIVDVDVPSMSAIELAQALHQAEPPCRIIVLSERVNDKRCKALLNVGASAILQPIDGYTAYMQALHMSANFSRPKTPTW